MSILLALSLLAAPQDENEALQKALAVKVTLDMSNAALGDVIGFIDEIAHVPFYFDPVGGDKARETTVSVKVNNVNVGAALTSALGEDYAWSAFDGVVVITNAAGKKAFDGGSLGGPSNDNLRKDKALWEKLGKRLEVKKAPLGDALKQLSKAGGIAIKPDALTKEALDAEIEAMPSDLSVLGALRMLSYLKGFTFELKGDEIVLQVKKKEK